MIRRLYSLVPDSRLMLRLGALTALQALLQGLLLGTLIPILPALLRPEPDFAAASPWLAAAACGLVLYGVLAVAATPIGFTASTEVARLLRQRLLRHAARLPVGWFSASNKARLARALTSDAGAIGQLAVGTGGPALTAVVTPLTIVAVTVALDWRVAALLAMVVPAAFTALRRAGRISCDVEIDLERAAGWIASRAVELGQAQPVLRAAGQGPSGTVRMREALEEHRRVYRDGLRRAMGPDLAYTAVVLAGFCAVLALGMALLLEGHLTVPETIALLVLTVRFLEPLSSLIELVGALHAMDNSVSRVRAILTEPPLTARQDAATDVDEASVAFDAVTFTYPGGTAPALSEVAFTCPAGSTTALIGPSGSGKTTVTRLVARFFDADQGTVRVGGVDVREWHPPALLERIAIVFQDVYLFDDTIEANLRLARPDASEADLDRAARAAGLSEVIERLPEGWQTRVGEAGSRLSGGERQRVSIARAFLKDAPIVLIDEAASSLDPENERVVAEAIAALTNDPDRTVIVIAHRPATLDAADHVVALDAGAVVESGAPDALLAAEGRYARLYRQFEAAGAWRIEGS